MSETDGRPASSACKEFLGADKNRQQLPTEKNTMGGTPTGQTCRENAL